MDGRVQLPVIAWLKRETGVDYVDMITEPGPVKILAEGKNGAQIEAIRRRLEISIKKHGANVVAIVGHYDCAGNPAEKEEQVQQINTAAKLIHSWAWSVQTVGLWVDEQWQVSRVS